MTSDILSEPDFYLCLYVHYTSHDTVIYCDHSVLSGVQIAREELRVNCSNSYETVATYL